MSNQKNKQVAMAAAIAMMLMVIACCTIVIAFNVVGPSVVDGDGSVVVIDDGGDAVVDGVDLKQCRLVAIFDKPTLDEDVQYLLTKQDDTFWKDDAPKIVLDVEEVEDSDDLGVHLIESFNLTVPVVILVDGDNELVWQMPYPKGGTDSIREKLK